MNQIKDDILAAIRGGTSFVELAREVPGWKGNFVWHIPGNPNVVLWADMSEDAISALVELLREKKIDAVPTSLLVYLHDGQMLQFPLVKSLKTKYKKPHWLPMVFNKEKQLTAKKR
jgi:hypothetical protein